MKKRTLREQLYFTIDVLYILNLNYGNLLNNGLENKIDQLSNLLRKQYNDLTDDHSP